MRTVHVFPFLFWFVSTTAAKSSARSSDLTNIFSPESTPAKSIFDLSLFLLALTGIIFVVVPQLDGKKDLIPNRNVCRQVFQDLTFSRGARLIARTAASDFSFKRELSILENKAAEHNQVAS